MTATTLVDHVLLLGSPQENELLVVDAATGGQLYGFKQCRAARHGVHVVPRTDHVVAVQDGKLALHVWQWGHDVPVWKCHVTERMGPVTSSSCGNFLVVGAVSGKVYVWDSKTGELVTVFDAHYKRVVAVAFTSDDSHVITGGDDAIVHVWRLVDILDAPDAAATFQQGITPVQSYTDHVLPITSVHVGVGGVNARIYSSSLDRTCKIWSLASSQCLYSIACPSYVTACIGDAMDHSLFLGCGNGQIYTLDLHAAATSLTAASARLATISTGSSSSSRHRAPWGQEALLPESFEGHESSISTLAIHPSGAFLVSGDDTGAVHVWDTLTRQSLRTIKLFKGSITALVLIPRPRHLFRQATARSWRETEDPDDPLATPLPLAPLKKYMNVRMTET